MALSQKFKEYRDRQLAGVRAAYGHVEGADDIDMLCLRISNICHQNSERIATLNTNGAQAQQIARLERIKAELLERLEGPGFDKDFLAE